MVTLGGHKIFVSFVVCCQILFRWFAIASVLFLFYRSIGGSIVLVTLFLMSSKRDNSICIVSIVYSGMLTLSGLIDYW